MAKTAVYMEVYSAQLEISTSGKLQTCLTHCEMFVVVMFQANGLKHTYCRCHRESTLSGLLRPLKISSVVQACSPVQSRFVSGNHSAELHLAQELLSRDRKCSHKCIFWRILGEILAGKSLSTDCRTAHNPFTLILKLVRNCGRQRRYFCPCSS
jgi:hypothetical protein